MIRTELSLRLPNSPGALAGVCRLLADERVNILALALESSGQLRMVVDNHVHAAGAQTGERGERECGVRLQRWIGRRDRLGRARRGRRAARRRSGWTLKSTKYEV